MPRPDSVPGVQAVLLDIEGTTTPVAFVYQVLFPFARGRVREFLEKHAGSEAFSDLVHLRTEHRRDVAQGKAPPAWSDDTPDASLSSAVAYVHWLMDQDRKSTALKSLQGKIWEEGYRSGELEGHVYPDVRPAMERWQRAGIRIAIYSSGSILAQQLLFSRSTAGDLTPFVEAHFDTTSGPKKEPESYRRIAASLGLEPATILFLSDVVAELDAARAIGMKTGLCVREEAPPPCRPAHPVLQSFEDISWS